MSLHRCLVLIFVATLLSAGGVRAEKPAADYSLPDGLRLKGGAGSVDELLDRFLGALEKEDMKALHELRVTKSEYLDIIVPGTVEKGKPPRQISEKPKEYFWGTMDFKAREFAKILARRYGGRHYSARHLRYTEAPREYSWYNALGQVRLDLSAQDEVYHLQTGWIVEVDGQYKFMSFEWEN